MLIDNITLRTETYAILENFGCFRQKFITWNTLICEFAKVFSLWLAVDQILS